MADRNRGGAPKRRGGALSERWVVFKEATFDPDEFALDFFAKHEEHDADNEEKDLTVGDDHHGGPEEEGAGEAV
jgi:hypothetical protein